MKTNIRNSVILLILLSSLCYAQLTQIIAPNMHSEVPIYKNEKGEKYSTIVTFQFSKKLIDIPKGQTSFQEDRISFPNIKNLLNELRSKYGSLSIKKDMPEEAWGDTIKINKRTKEMVKVHDLSQVYDIVFEKPVPIDSVTKLIKLLPGVLCAVGPQVVYSTMSPNDTYYLNSSLRWSFDVINAQRAWDITTGSSNVRIGINDCFGSFGVVPLHQELVNKVVWDSVGGAYGDHGSQVAGIAGASTNNSQGVASVGWNTSLMLTPFTRSGILSLITHNADVINFSWVSYDDDPLVRAAILRALQLGVVCVAAAGNNEWNIPDIRYPACYNFGSDGQVIAVSGTDLDHGPEEFIDGFNYSPGTDPINDPTNAFIDFAAPGANCEVVSDNDATNYMYWWYGTSMSSPIVSATVALLYSINNTLTPNQVYNILKATTDKIDQTRYPDNSIGWNQYLGYGRINAFKALKYLLENYGGTLSQNLTIPSGETWNFQPGVTINFLNGTSLIVNGTLNASGNSSNPITFNFTSPNATLNNGIILNSGSSYSTISYCIIHNADRGIYENGVSVNIYNSAISNCTNGIFLYNYSSPNIYFNNIHNNSYAGVYLISNSSPNLVDNFIQNNPQNGVYCTNSSNPILGYYNYNTYGNNITGNACGVFCWNNSSPILGNNSPVNGGSNNLDNTSWNLYSLYSGVVLAADNWWGNTNPSYFKISTTGSVTYSPYQHSPMLVPQPPLSKSGENLYASVSCDIPLLDQLNKANELIVENNLEQARNICLNLVKNYPDYSVSYNALNLIKDTYPASEINS